MCKTGYMWLVLCLMTMCATASAETIYATPETLADILERVEPGTTIICEGGLYSGGFRIARSGRKGAPITLTAGAPGVVFDGGLNGLRIDAASHIIVEGIRFQRAERAGIFVPAPAADHASHVTVRNCVLANNGTQGILTGFIDHMTIENCHVYGNRGSHGIYVSNSGDYPVVRGNLIHHNAKCGIHVNGDPAAGGDGVISFAIIENNRIWENGKPGGGSAINMTHVQDSIIRNNLAYNNYAGGIVTYYDTGGAACASKRNTIVNNTVLFRPGEGRWALALQRSSTDTVVKNNILVGGRWAAVEVQESSLEGLVMDHNVIANHDRQQLFNEALEDYPGQLADRAADPQASAAYWQEMGLNVNSSIGRMPQFENLAAADYRLAPGSVGIDTGADLGELVPADIEGILRPQGGAFDCGCHETVASAQ